MKINLIKTALILASFGLYTFLWKWQIAVILMGSIIIHESGHTFAMNIFKFPNKGFFFIPFLGAASLSKRDYGVYDNRCWIAVTGPAFSYLSSLVFCGIYMYTGQPIYLLMTLFGILGLANLLPIPGSDGWHAIKAMRGKDPKFQPMTSSEIRSVLVMVFWFCVSAGIMLHTIGWSGLSLALQFLK